jgi:hypothetical protein
MAPRSFSFRRLLGCTASGAARRADVAVGLPACQAALAVMNRGLRPDIPAHTPPALAELTRLCWAPIADQRPSFQQAL